MEGPTVAARFAGNQITEEIGMRDVLSLLRQIGALPTNSTSTSPR